MASEDEIGRLREAETRLVRRLGRIRRQIAAAVSTPLPPMRRVPEIASEIEPVLVRRARDLGWLALSPKHARFPIGVTALTEEEASALFCQSYLRWTEIYESGHPNHSGGGE
jgi:hypothetical protein